MKHRTDSAPGFAGAMPNQAAGMLTGPEFRFQPPAHDSATFSSAFQALDSLIVRSMRDASLVASRPAPRLGIASSTEGRATDVDDDKGAPYRSGAR